LTYRNKIVKASGYSILSEIAAKVVGPLGFLVLTRILSPKDFGIVAIATTILGFIYIVSDMGIGKVIIQETGDDDYLQSVNNAGFWFNTLLGILLFTFLALFSHKLAILFGEPKSSLVIAAMSVQVIFYSVTTVQVAIHKRNLDFKFLFYLRLITVVAPLILSIPLAFAGLGYWAIVAGNVFGSFLSALVLWLASKWKPSFTINFQTLRKVLAKSIWSTVEQVFMWIPFALDMYLITNKLSSSDYGIYSTSRTLFTSAVQLSLGAIIPVLYSAYSNIQNDEVLYKKSIMLSQKIVFALAAFIGSGVFIFRKLIEHIIFTKAWVGISDVYSVIFLIMGLEYFSSVLVEGLRARGYFRAIALNVVLWVVISLPFLFFSIKYGLVVYVTVRAFLLYIRYPLTFFYSKRYIGISFLNCIVNSKNAIICVIGILGFEFLLFKFNIYGGVSYLIRTFIYTSAGLIYFLLEKNTVKMLLNFAKAGFAKQIPDADI
jgi:O-antigen/teichoic acid export membrane protein